MSTSTLPVARAGRRRFWITVLLFAIVNAAAWIAFDRMWTYRHRGQLRVEWVEPGEGNVLVNGQSVRWHFDADVIPTSVYGRDPGKVTPGVRGHWAWENPRTLAFNPDADWPHATPVTFTLADTFLRSTTGGTLLGPIEQTLKGAPLQLDSVSQTGSMENDRYVLKFRFNDRVAPADVVNHLKLVGPDGRIVTAHLYGDVAGQVVRVLTDSIPPTGKTPDLSVDVQLTPGLIGLTGPLGIDQPQFRTVTLGRSLVATGLTAEAPMSGQNSLCLTFNNFANSETIKQVLTIEPAIAYTVESNGNSLTMLGDFASGTRYTVKLAAPPKGVDVSQYPRTGELAAFVPDRTPGVWFDTEQGYLSAAGNRTVMAHAVNVPGLRLSVIHVYDDNLVQWRNANEEYSWSDIDSFGKPLSHRTIPISAEKNKQVNVPIRLDEFLPEGTRGDGVYRIAIVGVDPKEDEPTYDSRNGRYYNRHNLYFSNEAETVVTLSDIALSAKQSRNGMVAWTTSLRTAQPLAGVRVRIFSNKNQLLGEAISDATGIARITKINPAEGERPAVMLADYVEKPATTEPATSPTAPANSALTWLDLRGSALSSGDSDTGGKAYIYNTHEAYLYTDRGVYRPGETVHLRAIVRGRDSAPPTTAFPVRWLICRPDLHEWKSQIVTLDADGAASLDLSMPDDVSTGQWTVYLGLPGKDTQGHENFGSASFQIEEFVPNRLKVQLTLPASAKNTDPTTTPRFSLRIGKLHGAIQADYLFGRPASGLNVSLITQLFPSQFRPRGWEGWSFGDEANISADDDKPVPISRHGRAITLHRDDAPQTNEETLDDNGHLDWAVDVESRLGLALQPPATMPAATQSSAQFRGPWRLVASAGVHEAGGRTVTSGQQIELDALPAYIGISRKSLEGVRPNKTFSFAFNLVQPDGKLIGGSDDVQLTLYRESWNTTTSIVNGRYTYNSNRILKSVWQETTLTDNGIASSLVTPDSNGQYVIAALDLKTGAFSSAEFYATDGSPWEDNVNRDNPERLQVRILSPGEDGDKLAADTDDATPTAQSFDVGDTVNVLVASPFPGQCLLTIETDNVLETRVIDMPHSHVVVPIKVPANARPNAFISATVIRPIDPNAKWRAHRAFGVARLRVDPSDRQLDIAIDAPKTIRPQESLDVGLTVTDSDGEAVANSAVTVAAVDEGICVLTDYKTPDPLKFFNMDRALGVSGFDVYSLLMPEVPSDKKSDIGGDGAPKLSASARHHSPVGAHRVKPVSLAWVQVHTDAEGHARASFQIPEFQGRLRVMAIAYQAEDFGSADQGVTVRSPIAAQTSWPRFAAPGDKFSVPVVLFNNSPAAGDAVVTADVQNDGPAILALGADHVAHIDLPVVNLKAGGQSSLEIPVRVNQAVGVAHIHLHVAMNGEAYDENLDLPVHPAAPLLQYSGVTIATTTQPAEIDAPVAMLAGTSSFQVSVTPWPTLQIPQGFDYLDRYPYGCLEQTTSTCFPLIALGEIGKQIDPRRFAPERMKFKIDDGIVRLIGMQTADGGLAMWTGESNDWEWGSVYAAHFLTEAKAAGYEVPDDFYKALLAHVRHLLDESSDQAEQLELQSYAAFVLALAGQSDRPILSRLTELAIATPLPGDENMQFSMRSDARLLLSCAWLLSGRRDLAENLIPQVLPEARTGRQYDGNIGSPLRDRAILIYALAMVKPDHPGLPLLVQQLADDGAHGRWCSTQDTSFAMMAIARYLRAGTTHQPYDTAQLLLGDKVLAEVSAGQSLAWDAGTTPPADKLSVRATGTAGAVAHVSWLQTGVPLAPPPDAEHGMKIHRRYFTLAGDELKSNLLRSGELVRVELTVEADPTMRNIVIEDMLPAGLEAENGNLATTAQEVEGASTGSLQNQRIEIRDDRVVILGHMPGAWKATVTYLARAVTPGVFVLPPVRTEAMYDISLNAISGGGETFTVTPAQVNYAGLEQD